MCDLFLCDCETNIINYADDTTLYACEPNMDLVSSKLEKDVYTVFTWFQNNYLKANGGKPHVLTTSDNFQHINVGGNQLSSSKYEELLGILIDHKLTFENHLLNIVQKVNQKLHALAIISKCMPQKKLRIIRKAFVSSQFAYCPLILMFHSRQINHKINKRYERALRILYNDHFSSFEELLSKDKSVTVIKEISKYLVLRFTTHQMGYPQILCKTFLNLKVNTKILVMSQYFPQEILKPLDMDYRPSLT